MPLGQIAGQVAPDVLELIRKTIFGSNVQNRSADFNGLFGPLSNPLAQSSDSESLSALTEAISGGGGPGTNASGQASPAGLSGVNALGSVVANAVMSAVNPLAPTAVNAIGHTPSTFSAFKDFIEAVFHPEVFNASIDNNAPESPNANDAGLSQAADSQAANVDDAGGDGADGPDGGSSAGGTGSSAGNAGDADGGSGGADAGDGGGSGGFFTGGFVPGASPGFDNKTINVEGGEFVVPSDIVEMLGKNFFEDLMLTRSPLQVAAEKEAAKMSKGAK